MNILYSILLFFKLIKNQIFEFFWNKRLNYNLELKKVIDSYKKLQNNKVSRDTSDIGTLFRNNKKNNNNFTLDNLNGIIKIDTLNKTVEVGGKTRYYDILNETLKYGLMPKIVPELSSITVGGAITGISIESSSFKYGWGHDSVVDMDIMISSGDILFCTADNKNKDLYNSIPNSYGTIGYVTRAKLELIESKPYVKLINHKFNDFDIAFNFINNLIENNENNEGKIDFLDGICYSLTEIVIVTGYLVDNVDGKLSNYPREGIYYETIREKNVDYMTIYDYYWRWDADMFWGVTDVSFLTNKTIRKIFGRYLLNTRTLRSVQNIINSIKYTIYPNSNKEKIIQDLGVPYKNATNFCKWIDNNIGIYPIWLCPVVPKKSKSHFWTYNENKLYFDIGVFGRKRYDNNHENEKYYYNKLIESELINLDGNKCFYSGTYFNKEDFNKFIDNELYSNMKKKYDPKNRFGNLYEKVICT